MRNSCAVFVGAGQTFLQRGSVGLPSIPDQAEAAFDSVFGLFLLPGGRPRLLTALIQAGGRPRRLPRPRARRSRLMMASSICSRSCRSSTSILDTSIYPPFVCKMYLPWRLLFRNRNRATHFLTVTSVVVQHLRTFFNSLVPKTEQDRYRLPRRSPG